ncbi:MAG TPA: SdrD B-like domain-containing protein [Gemmatimonadales bacterium]
MRSITDLKTTRSREHGTLLVLVSVLSVFAGDLGAQTPPGTVIRNLGTVSYQAATGVSFTPVSDSAFVIVGSPLGIAVTLTKSVDRASGTLGDTVTYTIGYQGLGGATATNVVVNDVLPAGAVYVPASISLNGTPLTDATGDDAGSFNGAARRVSVIVPDVTGSSSGTITFRARLDGTAAPSNVANVAYTTPGGPDSATSNAAQTTLLFSSISVAKLLDAPVAPAIARVGDAVQYRIRYDNPASSVVARNVIVTDTLSAFLQYVSAVPAPTTVSGSVLTWSLGDVAAGATADITLQTLVASTLPDSMTVINHAALALDNGPTVTNAAPPVLLLLAGTGQLSLGKAADVLEAGLGETVPYTLTIQNIGTTALSDFRIADRLPDGGRYAQGSALGVDSAVANGRDVTFYVAGPIAAGATFRVRYQVAIVSAGSDVLQNTAVATAQAGTVQSAPATAWVRIRHAWPLETRAVIGKVFADANGNGQQDAGEQGVQGVDVWTDDGEIATTDADGRFSFQNMRPGRHVYRIDPATLPEGLRVPDPAQARDGSGWTTPRVNFALAGGASSTVAAPVVAAPTVASSSVPSSNASSTRAPSAVASSAVAAPIVAAPAVASSSGASSTVASSTVSACGDFSGVLPGSQSDRATVAYFERNESRPHYILDIAELGRRIQDFLRTHPDCGVDIIGHADTSDVIGGPFFTNQRLSEERARWVAYQLHFHGLANLIDDVVGRGDRDPLAGSDDSTMARERRVEIRLVNRHPAVASYAHALDVAAVPPVAVVPHGLMLPALRDSATRADEQRRDLAAGPAVTVFAPADGSILATDRVFIGVHGEPGATVVLFDGATRIADGQVRGDGVHDFIAVPLTRGPHRLRVRMMNSWSQERWDSLDVHVSGLPAKLVFDGSKLVLAAGGQRVDTVHVQVLDQWSVPVVTGALVTVSAEGAEVTSADEDRSSVGVQVKADSTGVVALTLRGGRDVRVGSLALRSDSASVRLQLEVLPEARPFMMTAAGQVGVGASPDAFGAATARGRLDARTSVLVSVDSRQLDAGSNQFGRSVDPLGDAQYPILGDASVTRTRSASRYAVAARLERGLDWMAFGDLTTGEFASGLALSGYDRALAGVAGRVTTGAVVWQGFGSTSSERLAQQQIRGAGMSGPYDIGLGIVAGTEKVVLETRAFDNAQQALARQTLTRYLDYDIDYEHGLLLFKHPVPATDPSGNPVFIMLTYGTDNGGAESTVWGLRASADARGLVAHDALDSLRVGSTFIRDGRPGAERDLAGIDFGAQRLGRLAFHGELAHSQTPDSAGFATTIGGSVLLAKGLTVSGDWLRTDREFKNPANIALTGGTEDLRLRAGFLVGGSEIRVEHSAQSFDLQNVSRMKSGAFVAQRFGTLRAEAGVSASRLNTGTTDDATQASELRLIWAPLSALNVSAEARHHLGQDISAVQPDYIGAGLALKVNQHTTFEVTHRQVELPGGSAYGVTSLGGRSDVGAGTQAWGSYQLAGANGGHVAAVVGLNNRLRVGTAWTLNTLFERRFGLNNAPTADPIRALPFLQSEENYWSAGFGAEYLPEQSPYRFSLRSEWRDGEERISKLLSMAGAADLTRSFAVLTRQEFQASDDRQSTGWISHQRIASLNGLAFRPVGSDALNLLAKVEVIDERNPLGGGVLTAQTGHEARRILTAEAIWSPNARIEFGARYAFRVADATVTHTDSVVQALASSADYVGSRLDVGVSPWARIRGDGRLLHERTSGTIRWDAAPQLVLLPVRGIEIASGYRIGDLHDPDFAVRGGAGWFMTIGATLTEQSVSSIAAFWRSRNSQ